MFRSWKVLPLFSLLILLPGFLYGQAHTWIDGSGLFSDGSNWDLGTAPSIDDVALFGFTQGNQVSFESGFGPTNKELYIGAFDISFQATEGTANYSIRDNLVIFPSARLTTQGVNLRLTESTSLIDVQGIWIANSNIETAGSAKVAGPTSGLLSTNGFLKIDGTLDIGDATNGSGTVYINSLGSAQLNNVNVGQGETGIFTIDGESSSFSGQATVNIDGDLRVGVSGTGAGTIDILDGGTLNSINAHLGNDGGDGIVNVGSSQPLQNKTATWNNNGLLNIGSTGTAMMNINGHGAVTSQQSIVQNSSTVNISGEAAIWNTGDLEVEFGSTVNVSGAGAELNAKVATIENVGRLDVSNGATFNFEEMFLDSYSRVGGIGGVLAGSVVSFQNQTVHQLPDYFKIDHDTDSVVHGNKGLITGSGVTPFGVKNFVEGTIRIGSGESAEFQRSSNNFGKIEIQGGNLGFESQLVNHSGGTIDGHGRLTSGLINSDGLVQASGGELQVEGAFNLFGSIHAQTGSSALGSVLRFTEEFHSVTSSNLIRTDAGSQIVFGADYSGSAETFFGEGEVHFHGQVDPFLVSSANDINGELLFEGDVFLESTGNLVLDFGDATQGAFEWFEVLGNLHLDGEISINFLNGGLMEVGQEYLIAEVAGDQFGQFSGLPEGGLAAFQDGIGLFISYSGGDGNDVSLSAVAIPEPGSAFAVSVVMALACLRRKRKQTVCVAPSNSKPELRHSRIRNAV